MVVEPATSDDDSGPENLRPTLLDVADAICDSKMLYFSKKFCSASYQNPTLIFFHVSPQLKRRQFLKIIAPGAKGPVTGKIIDYAAETGPIRCAITTYPNLKEANSAYKYFSLKEETQTLGQLMRVSGVDCSVRWMLDKSRDSTSRWAGVVIRNLDVNTTSD